MEGSILAQRERVSLGNGMALRLLSALEVLQARREAGELAGEDRERALCSNACLLARALEQEEEHKPVFSDGRAVLAGLTVEEIGGLARRWSQLRRESDPGLNVTEEELENVKKKLRSDPEERLRWRVLREFHALPTERRAREMKDRDYLWCLANGLLDREEQLERLCPDCRVRAEQARCPVCGRPEAPGEGGSNPAFDLAQFQRLKEGSA